MGYIKEPDGVDFIIKTIPLSEREEKEFTEFIEERKRLKKIKTSLSTKRRTHKKELIKT
ncbi:MAG: hypothetical protein JNL75_12350 [Chitinophagales bacterium]|nr:hypothetical protein [Chitinophagales bacterium]